MDGGKRVSSVAGTIMGHCGWWKNRACVTGTIMGHCEWWERGPLCYWDHNGSLWTVGKGTLVLLGP